MSKRQFTMLKALSLSLATGLASVALAGTVPSYKPEAYPRWWFEQDLIPLSDTSTWEPEWPTHYQGADDFAAFNIGQLKYAAQRAQLYMDSKPSIDGGAGDQIDSLILGWASTQNQDDYAAVNLGQLKYVATVFYDRLIDYGLADDYPWAEGAQANDFGLANIGQLKRIFQFPFVDIPSSSVHWTVWSSSSPGATSGTATGQITLPNITDPIGVTYLGNLLSMIQQDWSRAETYAWPSTNYQSLTLQEAGTHVFIFSVPVHNVVMNWSSVGNGNQPVKITFRMVNSSQTIAPAKFRIAGLGSSADWGDGTFRRLGNDRNILRGAEGSGTIIFNFDEPTKRLEMTTDTLESFCCFQIGVID